MGDLCMYVGTSANFALSRRVIYQVIDREEAGPTSFSNFRYTFRVAFDFENPLGIDLTPVHKMGSRDLRKLNLIDLATVRLHFDSFIREWARIGSAADG